MMPEVSLPTTECPAPRLWSMHDDNSAELEVLEFLAQLVRTIKPRFAVETGTHLGWSAWFIGSAMMENNFGKLVTCETNRELYPKALEKLKPLRNFVDARCQSSLTLQLTDPIDFLFSDSDLSIRMNEVEHFWPLLHAQSIIAIHDVNTGCHKPLRDRVIEWERAGKIHAIFLPTPRGLALCQKRT